MDDINKNMFEEVDKKFWQVVRKERLLFEINNKINNKKKRKENVIRKKK